MKLLHTSSGNFLKSNRNSTWLAIRALLMISFLTISLNMNASAVSPNQQQIDSTKSATYDSIKQINDYGSTFIEDIELEHQKMIRNIFAASFVFVLVLLIFTMVFYGSKIKKVSNVIVMQNDALTATKDQLIKIINIFNYIDQQVYITDSQGIVEWTNAFATNYFKEKYEDKKINLIDRFIPVNQGNIYKAASNHQQVVFQDTLFGLDKQWKMIPIRNSKNEFSNMVFIS